LAANVVIERSDGNTLAAFFKAQRRTQEKAPAGSGAELLRDLEMVVAI
jgi:hypothetical protein